MKVLPVKHVPMPGYPDKYTVDTDSLLLSYRPKRWNFHPVVKGALTAVIALGLSACSAHSYKIPLFEHGKGTGSLGCDSVASPQFLSEEEAREVIRSELESAGLDFDSGRTLNNAYIPVKKENRRWYDTAKGTLETDATTVDKIGIEFVSSQDFEDWDILLPAGSVKTYHLRYAADRLLNNEKLAVFYDPVEYTSLRPEESEVREAKEKACEQLKEQVRDFIELLGAQGII